MISSTVKTSTNKTNTDLPGILIYVYRPSILQIVIKITVIMNTDFHEDTTLQLCNFNQAHDCEQCFFYCVES